MKVNGLMLKPMVRRQNGVPRLARPPRNLGFDPKVLSQGNIGRNQGEYPLSKLSVGQEPSCRLPGMWPPNGRVMHLVPDLSVFTDSESVREDHSRPRGAALAPNAGRSAWDLHPGWMTMESILPKKAAPPSPGGDEKHACSLLLVILTLLLCMRVPEHLFELPQSKPPKNQTSKP